MSSAKGDQMTFKSALNSSGTLVPFSEILRSYQAPSTQRSPNV